MDSLVSWHRADAYNIDGQTRKHRQVTNQITNRSEYSPLSDAHECL